MFRSVQLPDDVKGRLFLHSMPGRNEPYEEARDAILQHHVQRVVCLAGPDEVAERSPDYAQAISYGVPWTQISHPIPDFGIPTDEGRFKELANTLAEALRRGESILIHCAAGIGRTGTLAAAILSNLGLPMDEACRRVRAAGSSAETAEQRRLLGRIC